MKITFECEGEDLEDVKNQIARFLAGKGATAPAQTAASPATPSASAGGNGETPPTPIASASKAKGKKAVAVEEKLVEAGKSVIPVCTTHREVLDTSRFTAAVVDPRHCTPCQEAVKGLTHPATSGSTGKAATLEEARAALRAFVDYESKAGRATTAHADALTMLQKFGAAGLAPSDRCSAENALKPEHRFSFIEEIAKRTAPGADTAPAAMDVEALL